MKKSIDKNEDCYTLITGACGGLGSEFVKLCTGAGENLILTGTNLEKLKNFSQQNSEIFSNIKTHLLKVDLSSLADRESVANFIEQNGIKVTKLINNAGVIIEGDLLKFEDKDIINAVEVNCVGTLDLTQKLLKIRDKSQMFEVLTVASLASSYPIPHMATYAATKSFLVSIMCSLAEELKGENVKICTLCPGAIATTQAMKDSIKSMGLGGKLSCVSAQKVAKIGLRGLKKGKRVVIAGNFNKFLVAVSKPFSKNFMSKLTGKIWKKSQKKRGF